jgi:hypothetical protein
VYDNPGVCDGEADGYVTTIGSAWDEGEETPVQVGCVPVCDGAF